MRSRRVNGSGTTYALRRKNCQHCKEGGNHGFQASLEINGRDVRRNAPTPRKAEEALERLKAERALNTVAVRKSPTVTQYLKSWIDARDPRLPFSGVKKLAPGTIAMHRSRLRVIGKVIGNIRLSRLETADVARLVRYLIDQGNQAAWVNSCRDLVYQMLETARKERPARVQFNAAEGVSRLPATQAETYAMDEDQSRNFLAHAARLFPMWLAFFVVALNCGCRPGEMFALQWDCIDWSARMLKIRASLSWIPRTAERPREALRKGPKTSSGLRSIPLSEPVLQMLMQHRQAETERLGRIPLGTDLVWMNSANHPLDERNFTKKVFAPICEAAGLPHVGHHACVNPGRHIGCLRYLTPYSLRHTFATIALGRTETVAEVMTISRQLGHKSIDTTINMYGHVLDKNNRRLTDRMAEVFWPEWPKE